MPRLGELYPGICLTTEEKARKNLSQGSRRVLVYILLKRTRYKTHTYTPTHYKTHTYACIVRHTSIRDTLIMHSQRRLTECFRALHSQGHGEIRATCQPAVQVQYVEPARRPHFSLANISVTVQLWI